MPRLILRDRQLGVVARQLVTDANGAPCCCGGVCCPAEAPCLPTPYLTCNAGGDVVYASCQQNRGYRLKVQTTWRSLQNVVQVNSYIIENGRPRLVNRLVQVAQFALTASADYCVSSNPTGGENGLARLIPDTMRLQGVTFQSTTADGGSIFEFAASGDVAIVGNTCRSDQLPVVNQVGSFSPVVVELLYNSPMRPADGSTGIIGLYPIGAAPARGGVGFAVQVGPRCAATMTPNRWTTTQYTYADACAGGRLTWSTAVVNRPGAPPFGGDTTNYQATLETTWTREYCPCGGTSPQARGGGCSDCGDRSQLEVIA